MVNKWHFDDTISNTGNRYDM